MGRDREARRRAFEDLLAPHFDSIYFLARRFTDTDEDAEDLVQDAFVKAYRAFDSFTPGTSFKSWLARIVSNAAIDRFRRAGRAPRELSYEGAFPRSLPAPEHGAPIDPETLERFLPDEILHALDSLRPELRVLIVLRDLQDLSYKEISEALRIPLGTVMSRLFHARGALREALRRYAEDQGYVTRPTGKAN